MKIKKLMLVCLFLLSGCNLSYNEEFYLETINSKLVYNQYGKKHFLEHHENISPNETNVPTKSDTNDSSEEQYEFLL